VKIGFCDLGDANIVDTFYGNLFAATNQPTRTVYEIAALTLGGKIKGVSTPVRD
jgi:hypothetical protein